MGRTVLDFRTDPSRLIVLFVQSVSVERENVKRRTKDEIVLLLQTRTQHIVDSGMRCSLLPVWAESEERERETHGQA